MISRMRLLFILFLSFLVGGLVVPFLFCTFLFFYYYNIVIANKGNKNLLRGLPSCELKSSKQAKGIIDCMLAVGTCNIIKPTM